MRPERCPGASVWLLAAVCTLAGLGVVLASPPTPSDSRTSPWQAGTRGLGLSYAVAPAWTFHAYDPRQAPFPETDYAPLPGAPAPDPHAGAAVVDPGPLTHGAEL